MSSDPYADLLDELIHEARYKQRLNTISENSVAPWAENHQDLEFNDPSTLRIKLPQNAWRRRNLYVSPVLPDSPLELRGGRRTRRAKRRAKKTRRHRGRR